MQLLCNHIMNFVHYYISFVNYYMIAYGHIMNLMHHLCNDTQRNTTKRKIRFLKALRRLGVRRSVDSVCKRCFVHWFTCMSGAMINVVSVALLPWVVELPLATLRPVLVLQV